MKPSIFAALGRLAAVFLGMVWGFFVAFNVVFSDVVGVADMAVAVVFVAVSYVLLGAVFGTAGPQTGWHWVWWLAPPGVLLAAFQVFDNLSRLVYHAFVAIAVIAGTVAGAYLGSQMRTYRSAHRHHRGASPTA